MIILIFFTIHGFSQSTAPSEIKLVVRLKPGYSKEESITQIQSLLQSKSKTMVIKPFFENHRINEEKTDTPYDLSTIYLIQLRSELSSDFLIKKLSRLPFVKYVEPLYTIEILETPNDPLIGSQYYLPLIQAFNAHEITRGDTNIVIGIVDTGTDLLHEDLEANYKYNYHDPINGKDDDQDGFTDNYRGWDFGDGDNNPQSEVNNHGTMVAGMAAAVTNNGIGIASIGFHTKIMPIKVMDKDTSMETAYQGVVYAADHGCQIINCSWGGTVKSQLGADVMDYAITYRNCVVVAACGNSKIEEDYYPASYPGVISVAATDNADLKWTGSTFSTQVDVCAPGLNVLFTNQNNTYSSGKGTSFAAPLVAGAAALLKAYRPNLDALQIAEQLRVSSDVIDTLTDNQYFIHKMGFGRLNAYKALIADYLPALRITEIEYHSDQSEALLSGNELQVTFSATNYLHQVSNCIIKISTDSEYLNPLVNIVSTGFLETYGVAHFNENPFIFSISESIPYNTEVEFTFEFQAQANDGTPEGITYRDYQVFKTLLNKTYIDIEPNKIATTLTSNGSVGFSEQWKKTGKGFIYNQQENLLNGGGIILATDKNHMASALFGMLEFETLQVVDTFSVSSNVLKAHTVFQTIDQETLPLEITHQTFAYKSGEWETAILHSYNLKNTGSNLLSTLHMAFFTDWDIDEIENNMTGYEPDLHLFYTYAHANQLMYTGVCLVNKDISIPYGYDLITGGNGGMDITSNFSNEQKWFAMQNARPLAGNEGDSINVASQLSTGPYSIEAGDSLSLVWALIAAKNLYQLKLVAQSIRDGFLTSNNESLKKHNMRLYPNPASQKIVIDGMIAGKENTIQIFNLQGIEIRNISTQNEKLVLSIESLNAGIYLIRISIGEKLLIQQKIIKSE